MGVYTFKGHILVGGAISTVQVQFFRLLDFKNHQNSLQIRLKEYLRLTQTKSEKNEFFVKVHTINIMQSSAIS